MDDRDSLSVLKMSLPPCTHRPPCPGCPRYAEGGVAEAPLDTLRDLARRTGADLDLAIDGDPLGFRVRARLAVRGRAASPKLGIFQEGTHKIADIPSCAIHHPQINAVAREIRLAIRAAGVKPYADRPHVGLLRYVQLVVERGTGRVQVVLVTNDDSSDSIVEMARDLASLLGNRLQGLWWNGNTDSGNTILGTRWELLTGAEAVRESIGGADVWFPPGAFGQSNLNLADVLIADLHSRVPDGAIVAELYCGVGAIGLGLLGRSREVRFNEVNPHGLQGLQMGLAALPESSRAKASVAPGDAASAVGTLAGAEVAIVDPPRKGLGPAVCAGLREHRPTTLLYVSCDVDSLARDAEVLDGGYRLVRLTPYNLFPYTDHVETLAEFRAV